MSTELQAKLIIQISVPCNLIGDAVDAAGSSGRPGMHTPHFVLWVQAPSLPGEAEEHSKFLVLYAQRCNLTGVGVRGSGEKQIPEFSMTLGFPKCDLCSENLLSQMPFHTPHVSFIRYS